MDIRAATLPTRYGERMTLRLLGLQTEQLTLERLGMAAQDLGWVEPVLQRPHGLVLLTGPTGSGKTTTLYAIVRQLSARQSLNIVTIEDPIEYEIHGVAQVEVEAGDKVSFGKALRSVLRHDPDVLMIGEVRDRETLDVATKAVADRAPGPLDAAHQQRPERHHPHARHGRGTVPAGRHPAAGRGPAPGAPALPGSPVAASPPA